MRSGPRHRAGVTMSVTAGRGGVPARSGHVDGAVKRWFGCRAAPARSGHPTIAATNLGGGGRNSGLDQLVGGCRLKESSPPVCQPLGGSTLLKCGSLPRFASRN